MDRKIDNTFTIYILLIVSIFICGCEDKRADDNMLDQGNPGVIINEINYNSSDVFDPDDWIELYNFSEDTVNIGNWIVKDENDYHAYLLEENTKLPPNDYLVLCKNTVNFVSFFPSVSNYVGDLGFGFSGGGEVVRLYNSQGGLVDAVEYNDVLPWPLAADGDGPTLELIHPFLDNSLGENWEASEGYGTPGEINSAYSEL